MESEKVGRRLPFPVIHLPISMTRHTAMTHAFGKEIGGTRRLNIKVTESAFWGILFVVENSIGILYVGF